MEIVWDESLESGEAQLDADHREIVEWLGLVAAASQVGGAVPGVYHATRYLLRFFSEHSQLEESFMNVLGYDPEAAEQHKVAHQEFAAVLEGLGDTLEGKPSEADALQTVNQLYSWLQQHIHQHDQPLIDFVRAQKEAG